MRTTTAPALMGNSTASSRVGQAVAVTLSTDAIHDAVVDAIVQHSRGNYPAILDIGAETGTLIMRLERVFFPTSIHACDYTQDLMEAPGQKQPCERTVWSGAEMILYAHAEPALGPSRVEWHIVLGKEVDGLEADDYIDPSVEDLVRPILYRTRGVILFQEQMLELSMALAKYTGAEAEELRRAMGFTKGTERFARALKRLAEALRREGHKEVVVRKVMVAAETFGAYGFPESHAIGFAMLAYASTYLKIHRSAEFYASLLNNQPMGFYSPATLIQDGRRHGLTALPVCVQASRWECSVEGDGVMRVGLRYVRGMHEASALKMIAAREAGPWATMDDFLRRTDLNDAERRALASAGAFGTLAAHRRAALWQIEASWTNDEALFKQFAEAYVDDVPLLPMTRVEEVQADFAGLGLTTDEHPMARLRSRLKGITSAEQLRDVPNGQRVTIAGSVICRQRPGTAKGFVFISLEDETGIANSVVIPDLFERLRLISRRSRLSGSPARSKTWRT